MTRRLRLDAAVVGGGVVGAAAALALARAGLQTALLESREPPPWTPEPRDLRVYAFAPDNAALLERLQVWPGVRAARAQPYRHMRVWDAGGEGALAFDADALARPELGWIVEHALLVDRLWAALAGAGVQVHCPARVVGLEQDAHGVRLRLDDGAALEARVALAADGAHSRLRELVGIEADLHDYGQQGLVAYVESERPHALTAWQRFLPGGPLAVLPCAESGDRLSSIVWTLPEAEAVRLHGLAPEAFERELTEAFQARLGAFRLRSARALFPLRRLLAQRYVAGRVLLLGDAAHVVHPLAGQGVNLGLRDVAGLEALLADARRAQADWTSPHRLARWERSRRSECTLAAHAFSAINAVFGNDLLLPTLLRGPLLGVAGRVPGVAAGLARLATGLTARHASRTP